jgi:pimeloyl-ACP methyl ester carboxylesterase
MPGRIALVTRISLALLSAIASGRFCAAEQAPAAKQAASKKSLPLAGETFTVAGCEAFLIPPKASPAKRPTPWVWYAPTLPGLPADAERWMFEKFTAAGIAIAGIDVGESYGSPDGREKYTALYETLVSKRGLSPKPVLLGRSRGGLMLLCWACDNADKVGAFAGIYPVCDIASYPGIEKAAPAYRMTAAELQSQLARHNPPDRLEALARSKVPLFAIHGDVDTVVPLERNSALVATRYAALSGKMELVVPKGQGHNMWPGFFECPQLAAFVIRCAGVDEK